MKFSEWFQLNEELSGDLPKPIGRIVMLDMRFEDWPEENKFKAGMNQKDRVPAFFAVTPEKQHYLYYNGKKFEELPPAEVEGQSKVKGVASVLNSTKPVMPECPENVLDLNRVEGKWWDFTAGYDEDGDLVKVPIVKHDEDESDLRTSISKKKDIEWPMPKKPVKKKSL